MMAVGIVFGCYLLAGPREGRKETVTREYDVHASPENPLKTLEM